MTRLLSLYTLGAKVKGLVKSRRLNCHMAAVQEAHGQRRAAKAPGTVPVCAPFRRDGAIDLSDRSKHDIDPIFVFIFFFLVSHAHSRTHDQGTEMSCTCTSSLST